jgi:hypothetical protein
MAKLISRPCDFAASAAAATQTTYRPFGGTSANVLAYEPDLYLHAGTLYSLVSNGARQFTAANSEYLSIADNADLSGGDVDFFVSCWVYFDDVSASRVLINKGDTGATGDFSYKLWYRLGSTDFRWTISDGVVTEVDLDAGVTPSSDTWYHVFAWHDNTNNQLAITVNGSTPATITAGTVQDDSGALRLGGISGAFMDGRICNAIIGKPPTSIAALWPSIHSALYNNGNKPDLNDLTGNFTTWGVKGAWPLDERSGNATDISGNSYTLSDNNSVTEALGPPAANAVNLAANNDLPSIAVDSSGNGNHGTISGTTAVASQWLFDADTSGWVRTGNDSDDTVALDAAFYSTSDPGAAASGAAWIKTTESGTGTDVIKQNTAGGGRFNFFFESGTFKYWKAGATIHSATTTVNDGDWHHVAFTKGTDRVVRIYVDGVVETGTGVDNNAFDDVATEFGVRLDGGSLYGACVENAEWTAAEVLALKNGTVPSGATYLPLTDGPNLPGTITPASGESADASYSSDVPAALSGINDYVWEGDGRYVKFGSGIIPTSGDFTFIARVNLPASTSILADYVVVEQAAASFLLYSTTDNGTANGQIRLYVGIEVAVGSDIRDGNDHSIAVVKSGTIYTVYLDGVEDTSGTTANVPASGAGYIGTDNGSANWAGGTISDVRVYNSAISESAIAAIHSNPANATYLTGGSTPPLLHCLYGASVAPGMTITDGDGVDRWNDLGGSNYDFTQTSVSLRPTYDADGVGGKPALNFNGSSQYMEAIAGAVLSGSAGTVIAVVKRAATGAAHTFFSSSDTALATKYVDAAVNASDQLDISQDSAGTATSVNGSTSISTTDTILTISSSGTAYRLWVAGGDETESGTNNGDWFADTADRDNTAIGALVRNSVSQYLNGHIATILVWETELSDSDRQAVERLLSAEYGITLS